MDATEKLKHVLESTFDTPTGVSGPLASAVLSQLLHALLSLRPPPVSPQPVGQKGLDFRGIERLLPGCEICGGLKTGMQDELVCR